jgi:hypothetical protein
MAAVVKDPAPRLVSPILFILAGLCFLLPFAGVSCNTAAATTELGSLSSISQQLGGGVSSSQSQALTGCLNSLGNYDLATYTGLDLTTGSSPSVTTAEPSGCSALSSQAQASVPTSTDASQIGIGVQPLLLVALAAMLLGLILSLTRFAFRGLLVAASAVAAIVLLAVEHGQVSSQILDRISHSVFASISGSGQVGSLLGGDASTYLTAAVSTYFTITVGIGLILAIAALAVVAVYNLAAQLVQLVSNGTGPRPLAAYTGGPAAPPGAGWAGGSPLPYGASGPLPPPYGGYGPLPPSPSGQAPPAEPAAGDQDPPPAPPPEG